MECPQIGESYVLAVRCGLGGRIMVGLRNYCQTSHSYFFAGFFFFALVFLDTNLASNSDSVDLVFKLVFGALGG